ncbi:MAG TPA: aldo/keto reductase [Bacteroidia bacterium]|jgi:diketogulonate reductase-like aldo/keto reductase|nr:aldo/keto reductase [Bacteroidia bacterium]
MIHRTIPSSGETLPLIGLGTWQTFDTPDSQSYPRLQTVLSEMHNGGGSLIDSSPMYGLAEKVIGDITSEMPERDAFFYATKVWTTGREAGIRQMESSMQKMKRKTMDLMQIHNLSDWKTHLPVLREWKAAGKIRYTGITHYTDSMHAELESVFSTEKIDFVQFNYSIDSRHAEKRLLDAAAHHGVATLINRPFGEGRLFKKTKNKTLPSWATECDIHSWSAYFLKFIVSHPAVTCVIPATADPVHATENFKAGSGKLPDAGLRKKMIDHLATL